MRTLRPSDASSALNSLDDAKILAKRLAAVLSIDGTSSCSASSLLLIFNVMDDEELRVLQKNT